MKNNKVMKNENVKSFKFNIEVEQLNNLRELSKKNGLTMSEQVRAILEKHIGNADERNIRAYSLKNTSV